ncbi:methyltransferase, TIGR04325 family [Aliarcobacter cryaerophilus]|uniref:methyltransferase, TIGR04325 family n=1 Tax=Aliarcobacter cryaerophilus TaxID=28198 RepID=UPI003DA5F932
MKNNIRQLLNLIIDAIAYLSWKKRFASFRGVYNNFEDASKAITKTNIGYDNPETVERYLKNFDKNNNKISEMEYPLFFWLAKIILCATDRKLKVFDFGGNLGGHYFKFTKTTLLKDLSWTVCEVNAIAEAGNKHFANSNLNFVSDIRLSNDKDVFISSGAIQYIGDFSLSLSTCAKAKACSTCEIANANC